MRKYDIAAVSTGGQGPRWSTGYDGLLQGTAGANALSNLVLRLLFTTKGTCPTARNEGTFLSHIAGSTVDLGQVQAMVAAALIEVETYIKKMQLRVATPQDETLVRLSPQKILLSAGDTLTVRILIYSADKTTVPLDVTL